MYMMAGPNGAGKSTFYTQVLQRAVDATFINADLIQRDELKDPSMQASYKAAEIAEGRRRDHLRDGKSFISESTLSHPFKLELVQEVKEARLRLAMYHVRPTLVGITKGDAIDLWEMAIHAISFHL